MALKPVTVSQLNDYISRVLSTDPLLGNISVTGEISNLKFHSSGHVYFSMLDSGGKINCFLPASSAEKLNYELGDGLEIVVNGYINVYKKGGTYTLFIRNIEVCGEGNLAMAFELLKKKLEAEGLFDRSHKKPIPKFPKNIGLVTSKTGAAIRDMLKIIQSRTKLVDVTIFPVLVQGSDAALDMANTLDMINRDFPHMDLLILGRGGGSAEDLWAFNEEVLARAVYRSEIPIISAVGHEIDFSITDFVADMRAETPTAAAEKAVPDDEMLLKEIARLKRDLLAQLKSKVDYYQLLSEKHIGDISRSLEYKIEDLKHRLKHSLISLEENNPLNILSKGYNIMEDDGGNVISSYKSLEPQKKYKIYFKDGSVEVTLSDIITLSETKREGE